MASSPWTSPYGTLHADDPIPWMPWGAEAFERARVENKPIFVSVGFSTCYWCHAMARESFREAGLAALLTREVVCVLVDRDQRPDVDEVLLAATQVYSHTGGWPNTLFLDHDGLPYFCGTYFPLEDHRGGPGFRTVVESMVHAWRHRRDEVAAQAAELEPVIRRYLEDRGQPAEAVPGREVVEQALAGLEDRFDPEHGGFGSGAAAPGERQFGAKFPAPANLHLLQALAEEQPTAASMLATTLEAMARGGIHDQLGGGFHRYAGDRRWNRPHFEKMLEENGHLLEIYAREALRTGDARWSDVTRQTADFLLAELRLDDGVFANALAGDDAGRPGGFYRWTLDELAAALGEEDAAFLAPFLGYDGPADGGGAHVLHQPRAVATEAARRRLAVAELEAQIAPLVERLRQAREDRPRPWRDEQVLAAANGRVLAGLVVAAEALDDPDLLATAKTTAEALWARLVSSEGLWHSDWQGQRGPRGMLADYGALIHGLLALHRAETTGSNDWLDRARLLAEELVERLAHPAGGFTTSVPEPGDPQLPRPFAPRPVFDDALPAANGEALIALVELAEVDPSGPWRTRAESHLRALAGAIQQVDSARSLVLAVHRFHALP